MKAAREAGALAGRIVASHGRSAVVQDDAGRRIRCKLQGRRLAVVCGDSVSWTPSKTEGAEGLIITVDARRTVLSRLTLRGESEPVAANLTQLVAVVACVPAPDFGLCDRYLAAAEWAGLKACVVANKTDLAGSHPSLDGVLAEYAGIGYPVLCTSKRTADGTRELALRLDGETSVLVGQSGVGKSSLINRLVPGVEATVDEVSRASETGRHTTTSSSLYRIPTGGELVDSPGVRDFSPPLPAPKDITGGFREIAAVAGHCRFSDCRHGREPGCAVIEAADAGAISRRRLAVYRRLLGLAEGLAAREPRLRR